VLLTSNKKWASSCTQYRKNAWRITSVSALHEIVELEKLKDK